MAVQDYDVTAAGHRHVLHNGNVVHTGRKLSLDPANLTTVLLLKLGYITGTSVAPVYEGSAGALTTYTVTASGAAHINHNQVTLANGATLQIDAQDDTAKLLVSRGWIV